MSESYTVKSTRTAPLPAPAELIKNLPIQLAQEHFISQARQEIKKILLGENPRLLLIVGPCSIHDLKAAKEFAQRLKELSEQISDIFYVVMRVYFEKPRTALGWKGLLYDPHLDGSNNITAGLKLTRQLLLDLACMEVPAAAEFLDPLSSCYFGDLISWGCIGARTASSQTHRQMASGLPMPVAFKNSTDGNLDIAINGIIAASEPHTFIGINELGCVSAIHTHGNPDTHIVLRGGESSANYDPQSLSLVADRLKKANLPLRLLIDCSHDNSRRKHEQQCVVFQSCIHQFLDGNKNIRGVILESHLFGGNQQLTANLADLRYAVSLTDPCLDWETTKELIEWGYAKIKNENSLCQKELTIQEISANYTAGR